VWIGFIWLRTGTDGGLLWRRLWAFGFHKMRGISWVAEEELVRKCPAHWSWCVGRLLFHSPVPCVPASLLLPHHAPCPPSLLFFRYMLCEGMRCEPSHRPTPASIPLEWTWTVAYQWYLCRGAGCRWWTRKFAMLTCTRAITLFGPSVSAVSMLQFMFVETFYLSACVLYYLYQSCMFIESVPFEVDNRP